MGPLNQDFLKTSKLDEEVEMDGDSLSMSLSQSQNRILQQTELPRLQENEFNFDFQRFV